MKRIEGRIETISKVEYRNGRMGCRRCEKGEKIWERVGSDNKKTGKGM